MFTFTSEFFLGVLIGFVLGLLVNWLFCNGQLYRTGALFKTGESKKLRLITKLSANKTYSPDLETLWKDLRQLYEKRSELDPKFSFNEMAFEICNLLGEGKAVAASTIRNFYFRRTNPRKKTIEVIQRWIDEEKVNHSDGDDENKEIDDSDNVINSSNNKKDKEI
jgi:hypothetical protein